MANVVRDSEATPERRSSAISPQPNPLVTFKPEDVAFTYGAKWKQRYWKKQGDDYFVLPAQWDVRNKVWRAYHVQPNTDWRVPFYLEAQEGRPTGPLCDDVKSARRTTMSRRMRSPNGMSAASAAMALAAPTSRAR